MTDPARHQLTTELAHWRAAIANLADLSAVAAPEAWAQLEDYMRLQLRRRLLASISALAAEGAGLAAAVATDQPLNACRSALLRLRQRYLAVEATVEFYGDAVQQRTTPGLGAVLRGLDTIAVDAMEAILRPLGIETPPALVYPEKGRGAAILKAGIRLWDRGGLSPVAAIKVTRHNLAHPTAILHESSHQTNHLTGWNTELGQALADVAGARSTALADLWSSWASEIAADVGAFMLCGWPPVPALANVVDGTTTAVHRIRPGDPHPPAWLRVKLNVELCRNWFGPGPWDALGETWQSRHAPSRLPGRDAQVASASMPMLPEIAAACTRRPFKAFGGRPLSALADPRRVSPAALAELARTAGDTLLTSAFLARNESLRVLAVLTSQQPSDPAEATVHTSRLHKWLAQLAPVPLPRAA
ncbi:hypothetical protein ACQEVF_57010 [Nonomuraea polychroma]|uniref:hypothetical protein n=1 Tax=Nonomuraea polychroma TaxID=46176 RepID=UPI003D8CD78E